MLGFYCEELFFESDNEDSVLIAKATVETLEKEPLPKQLTSKMDKFFSRFNKGHILLPNVGS